MRPKHDKEHFQQSNSHANLVNIIQNTNELYKNTSHNMGSKTLKQFHIIISKS